MVIWKAIALMLLGAFLALAALHGWFLLDRRDSQQLYVLTHGCGDIRQHPDDSLAKCAELLERYPARRAEAFFGRGQAYFRKGDYDRAIIEFSQAIDLDAGKAIYY